MQAIYVVLGDSKACTLQVRSFFVAQPPCARQFQLFLLLFGMWKNVNRSANELETAARAREQQKDRVTGVCAYGLPGALVKAHFSILVEALHAVGGLQKQHTEYEVMQLLGTLNTRPHTRRPRTALHMYWNFIDRDVSAM